MRDRKLVALVVLATILSFGHTVDHILRGDLHWPLTRESLPFVVFSLVTYVVVGGGLYLYVKGTIGPRFWAIVGGTGVVLGWLGHFSPFTDQPPRYILGAYASSAAGWFALAWLVLLMLVLIVATVYAVQLSIRSAAR
jgi:hypothetical protein